MEGKWGRRAVLLLWPLVLLALGFPALSVHASAGEPNLSVDGSASDQAKQLLQQKFDTTSDVAILLRGPAEQVDEQGRRLETTLARKTGNTVLSPWTEGGPGNALRAGPDSAMLVVLGHGAGDEMSQAVELQDQVKAEIKEPVTASLTGEGIVGHALEEEGTQELAKGELYALPILLLILLVVFRSVLAATIPIVVGASVLIASSGVISLLSNFITIDTLAVSIASMMALALGVDYSLLIVSRFREELGSGSDKWAAAAAARRTAGKTVLVAGAVLVVAVGGALLVSPGPFLVSATVAVGIAAVMGVLGAVGIVPVIAGLAGTRINGRRRRDLPATGGLVARLCRAGLRRPISIGAIMCLALLALSWPATTLKTGTPGVELLPRDNPAQEDYARVSEVMGPGWAAPFTVVVSNPDGPLTTSDLMSTLDKFQSTLAAQDQVSVVFGPAPIAQRTRDVDQLKDVDLQAAADKLSASEDGARQLEAGLGTAMDASRRLSDGAAQAKSGTDNATDGLATVQQNVRLLIDGLTQAVSGAGTLRVNLETAAGGAQQLDAGLTQLRTQVEALPAPIDQLADELARGGSDLQRLREPAQIAQDRLRTAFNALLAMSVGKLDPQYLASIQATGEALGAITGRDPITGNPVSPGYNGLDASLAQAASGLQTASDTIRGYVGLASSLVSGAAKLSDGEKQLAAGLALLTDGARQLESALVFIRDQVTSSTGDVGALVSQADALTGGLSQLADGNQQLSKGLADARAKVGETTGAIPSGVDFRYLVTESPGVGESGYLRLATVDGARPESRAAATAVLNVDNGGDTARFIVIPKVAAGTQEAADLSAALKAAGAQLANDAHLVTAVGGPGQLVLDFSDAVSDLVPLLLLVLSIASYLVLAFLLRSVLVPLVAVVLNVLTVGSAFGVLALMYNGSAAPGEVPSYVAGTAVLGIMGILFGLSIDYQVFLLSRIKETWLSTGDPLRSISDGISGTARVITGAAMIMIGVFTGFALTDFPVNRQLGIGLVVAVAVDATLVRLLLLPGILKLLGTRAWWWPGTGSPRTTRDA